MTDALAYPPLSPYLSVSDGRGAIAFYAKAFDAKELQIYAYEGRIGHAALEINGSVVMLADDYPEYAAATGVRPPSCIGGASITINLSVDDVDAWHERAIGAGAAELRAPKDEFYGRASKIRDPFGHVWGFVGSPDAERGASAP